MLASDSSEIKQQNHEAACRIQRTPVFMLKRSVVFGSRSSCLPSKIGLKYDRRRLLFLSRRPATIATNLWFQSFLATGKSYAENMLQYYCNLYHLCRMPLPGASPSTVAEHSQCGHDAFRLISLFSLRSGSRVSICCSGDVRRRRSALYYRYLLFSVILPPRYFVFRTKPRVDGVFVLN